MDKNFAKKPNGRRHQLSAEEAEQLARQVAELTEALQRERADIINVRRQHEEQIANLKVLVKASIIRDLLPVIDNFERALKHIPEQFLDLGSQTLDKKAQEWVKGVMGIKSQFEKTLEQIGVERIKTVGQVFDPRYHEAVSMEEGNGTTEIVSEELQAGYKLGDDILRHAMVRVKLQ